MDHDSDSDWLEHEARGARDLDPGAPLELDWLERLEARIAHYARFVWILVRGGDR